MDDMYSFENQMKELVKKFKKDYNLQDISGEKFADKLWLDQRLALNFTRAIIEKCNDFSGDEIFK